MSLTSSALSRLPDNLRDQAFEHRELLKFVVVGGTCFVIDTVLFFALKSTVLVDKPVTAKIFATLVATIVSYVLNREWSFRTRGGRQTRWEAPLFFLVSAIGLGINSAPLWVSSYVLDLRVPDVSPLTENIADFVSAQLIGTVFATVFRFWAFKRFVFPDEIAELEADLHEVEAELRDERG